MNTDSQWFRITRKVLGRCLCGWFIPSSKMSDGNDVIKANIDKRIQVEFIYSSVPQAKMIAVLEENISNNPQFSSETVASIRNVVLGCKTSPAEM